ncbi:MAG: tRNA pseudouridine(55) synthase TruB [Hyphomicrobium sp.]|jgi:tRNA pseudouridine55 synthase|uniref:tRNA pseudouridine(55) synthase TruB n=1 Tax=Hyphomicrobium sp. TaxID=82 RepID=UPI0025B830AD|nr:tRNA pseudouridine(55) synthase TruB [Hyphomicrobium sp.]MBX9864577.1 tRNA pseudouridine(55) synthase TruB [Hyphomicrobium sp.]
MARRKKGNPIHGWLVLDKPLEMTSTRAVGILKRLMFAQKVGHAGTLDPLATGILPIAFGEATKTVPFAVDGEKVYRFVVRWGAETKTDDAEGDVTATSDARPTVHDIEALLPQFIGEIMQVPPQFSAIKVDGERAYALARDGEHVELEARPVVIDELRLIDVPDGDTAVFEARCGKGTYVRAIARDMGRALGCRGHVVGLRRTRVGPFSEDAAVDLAEIEDAAEAGEDLSTFLQPVEVALGDILEVNVSAADAADLAQGRSVLIRGRDAPILGGTAYAMSKGQIVALGEIERGALHPTRVFNFG